MKLLRSASFLSVFLLITGLFTREAQSQGCSDAGICTVHSMMPEQEARMDSAITRNNTFNAGVVFGMSQWDVLTFTPYLEYSRSLGQHFSLTGRFTYGLRSGELGDIHGPSDLFLSLGYTFLDHFTMTGGVKVPMNNANKAAGGDPLPMNYQTSLGTVDLLLGMGYTRKRFSVMAGYQQPVTQNGNQFFAGNYAEDAPEYKYFSTRNYHRAADVMLRVSYMAVQSEKITLLTSVLPIYHLQNDTYEEPDGDRVALAGSQGLTLNLNVVLKYYITPSQSLELNLGAPAAARSVRPDGLSKFAAGVGYSISF
jgi:hypothetical protein